MKGVKRKAAVSGRTQKLEKRNKLVSENGEKSIQEIDMYPTFDDDEDEKVNTTAFGSDDSDQVEETDDSEFIESEADEESDNSNDSEDDEEEDDNSEHSENDGEEANDLMENNADDEDEEAECTDPFTKHFGNSLHPNLLDKLESPSSGISPQKEIWPVLRNIIISMPSCQESEKVNDTKKLLDDDISYTTGGNPPKIQNLKEVNPKDMHIKLQIIKNLRTANCSLNESSDEGRFMTEFQNELFCIMSNYQDLYYAKETLNNNDSIRFVYCLHMANHILKTMTKVLRHNTKLKNREDDEVPDEYRDQGFVRPKVVVLLPFKSAAYKVISVLGKLLFGEGKKGSVMNKKRFLEEYQKESQRIPVRKPEEYKTIFSGNTEDDFTMGISVTRKALKLYSEFYSSDIIIASPLSLRRIIGAEGEKERDYDFLSSIELLIMDQADIFTMQNWHHILHIFNHLHLKLKEYRRTDFSRVRPWSIEGHAKFYRQTLIFTSVNLPIIKSLFMRACHNYAGNLVVEKIFSTGAISNVLGERQHNFYKFSVDQTVDIPKKRFECFLNEVLPMFREDQSMRQVLIYIPSYYDFVKLRNYFMKESINFMQICEHSKWNKVAEARDLFFNRDVHFLLYTERFHFYNRITLKGIRHIIFYETPSYPHYYSEICNMMGNDNVGKSKRCYTNFSISVLYSRAEHLKLAAIVGNKKAQNMIASERNVHQIFTEDV